MNQSLRAFTTAFIVILTSACGGANSPTLMQPPPAANYNLQAGMKEMVTNGLSSNVALSGTVTVTGVSTAFAGSGTFTRPPATSATFNGTAALSQTTMLAGSVTAAGQTTPYSTSVTDYYASNGALLGEITANEYDVAQTPILFPDMVVGGSSGTLGTLSRYTDSTTSVSLGTAQVSYFVMAPVDPGSPIGVAVTTNIYDAQNALTDTEVTNYTMTSSSVISFAGASAQNQSGTLKVTPQ